MISEMLIKENARITHEWAKCVGDGFSQEAIDLAEKQGLRMVEKAKSLGYKMINGDFVPDEELIMSRLRAKYKNLG